MSLLSQNRLLAAAMAALLLSGCAHTATTPQPQVSNPAAPATTTATSPSTLATVTPAPAATSAVAPTTPQADVYFAAATIDPGMLPPPPAKGSPAWQRDLEQVLTIQRQASEADKVAAAREQSMTPMMVAEVLGLWFTPEKLPRTFALLEKVGNTGHEVTDAAKAYWNTPRPWVADARVKALVPNPNRNGAYPSGHTSGSRLWAEVLGQIVPDKRDALRTRARSIAEHRMVGGMHYPHDLTGGEQLALLVFGALQTVPAYQADLAAARAEVQALTAATAPVQAPAEVE